MADTKVAGHQLESVASAKNAITTNSTSEQEEASEEKAAALKPKHECKEEDQVVAKVDKLDELCSLEQEIAKMHSIQQTTHSTPPNGSAGTHSVGKLEEQKCAASENKLDVREEQTETPASLEEVDLIALLKGTDTQQEPEALKPVVDGNCGSSIEIALAALDNVGVTIEGEGQYEIMEIDDGDNASGPSPVPATTNISGAFKTAARYVTPSGKPKLSPEQARAVALEQMADLKAQKTRRKDTTKQQAQSQPISQPQDIINTLNDDWNDYESGSDSAVNANCKPATNKKLQPKKIKSAVDVVVLQSTHDKLKPTAAGTEQSGEATGFRRTRIIKRKIIWDPDAPETQKSFAQYASNKGHATAPPAVIAKPTTVEVASPKRLPKEVPKTATVKTKTTETNLPIKRRAQTPSLLTNGAVGGGSAKKKKITEIDRLMGDEGAANMMQAVEREQRELSGGELPNKPLMRKRALTITGRSQKVEVPPAAPKKESPTKNNKRATPTSTTAIPTSGSTVDAVFVKAPKSRASDTWDYVYKQRASEESMIMRRRSNSSYSSNASVSRLSLDTKPTAVANLSDDAAESDPTFKFLKPVTKANQRSEDEHTTTLTNDLKTQHREAKDDNKQDLVTLHKLDKVAHLIIQPPPNKLGSGIYKLQLLQKLNETLNKLAKSNDCNTVLLSVQGAQFCEGIDGQELLAASLEKRKHNTQQLALVLKTYLRTLATFPKPLLAGVVGNLKNLGLMQLPLFDYVVAADDCCLENNYHKLGQLPEGYALWHKHPKVNSSMHTRLFLLGERLQATDVAATLNSFIDKTCKARSVNEQALAVAKLISTTTAEHYRTLKKLQHTANSAALQRLESEFKLITEQWSSASFQANYKRYLNDLNI
ncbi:CG3680 [Drosophila busckii]|uniref:CG3680 n=1 Tax=Drosophila busckii TaxID=30019 RepID=A0A0M3QW53_DROBS|nr:CG3680 [Drosophila busckii]